MQSGSGNNNKQMDYLPTKKFKVSVDKNKVLENGTVPKDKADRVVDNIEWSIEGNGIYKKDLIILDILAANDWERPIYFAITTGDDAYLGLTDYFQIEGCSMLDIDNDGIPNHLDLDSDNDGLVKMKRVGYQEDDIDYEVCITGINKCPQNNNGWIPHFLFDSAKDNGIEIQVAKIDKEYYGKALDLGW